VKDTLEAFKAAPFIKWVGGKRQLLDEISVHIPKRFHTYHEPFLGSGAVFFYLWNLKQQGKIYFKNAILSDINEDLITTFLVVRDKPSELIKHLSFHAKMHSKEHYYSTRALPANGLSKIDRAARFIYLNKTCFNGLYRVNAKGQFNVPIGSYVRPNILDEERIRAASVALADAEIFLEDFRRVGERAKKGDFVYFDPPYIPLSPTSSFTSYTQQGFDLEQQEALAALVKVLNAKQVRVLLSNSSNEITQGLYRDFKTREVFANRAINSKATGRGRIKELLVTNYD
jgi:DNA adenine methylase